MQVNQISDDELADVVRIARKARGGKSVKYVSLEKYRESIVKLMQQDVQLSHILRWLKNKHGEQIVLNTLRKYVVRNIGREIYEEYLARNHWIKTKGRERPGVVVSSCSPEKSSTESSTVRSLDFLDFKKPAAFRRAIDDESEKK
ncbi:hypothetical protein [Propionivibrio soli]|uniref:hypothetical protein n=1 Tax=Propionivibrio soli TaxID=2976531 RepID=UPI0021E71D31|nr:hypothetical protein [Propionivibrio soli]